LVNVTRGRFDELAVLLDDVAVIAGRRRLAELVLESDHRIVRLVAKDLLDGLPLGAPVVGHREGVPPRERPPLLREIRAPGACAVGRDHHLGFGPFEQYLDRLDPDPAPGIANDHRTVTRHAVTIYNFFIKFVRSPLGELDHLTVRGCDARAHFTVVETEAIPPEYAI
jgi:hypothetical protein